MLPTSQETLTVHYQERDERIAEAARHRTAEQIVRARRARRWAQRLERLAARLDQLAQTQRARLS
ncbi:MAG: hypothetical protein ACRDT4_00085 [Micromonosporaceae bacterium]